jgi:hypothetical protein
MIQKRIFSRDVFLSILGVDSNVYSARAHRGEVAVAFGLSKPAFQNSYGEIDLVAAMLTFFIINLVKIDMAAAAELVRRNWEHWLYGIARTEHLESGAPYSKSWCFVVSMNMDRTSIEGVEVGICQKVIDAIADRDDNLVPIPVPLDLVVRQLRRQASRKKVVLPKPLTPDPGEGEVVSDAYETWLREIEDYVKFAETRSGGATRVKKRKAKPRATA